MSVAQNPNTPVDVLRKLAEDKDRDIRIDAIHVLNSFLKD